MKKALFVPFVISVLMLTACTSGGTETSVSTDAASQPQTEITTIPETTAAESETQPETANEEAPVEPDIPPEEISEPESAVSSVTLAREEPPQLTAKAGGSVINMARNSYTWRAVVGDEICETVACGDTAYHACETGSAPKLSLTGADTVEIDLPDDAEITSALLYISDGESELLDVSGGIVTPAKPYDGVNAFSIEITFPEGKCEYVFSGVYE